MTQVIKNESWPFINSQIQLTFQAQNPLREGEAGDSFRNYPGMIQNAYAFSLSLSLFVSVSVSVSLSDAMAFLHSYWTE
jgi:hypothetical protein